MEREIILLPFHIKLGLMKQFVKVLKHGKSAFLYLKEKFPKISNADIKEDISDGTQIRQLIFHSYV